MEILDLDDSMVGYIVFFCLDLVRKIFFNVGSWCLIRYKEYLFLDNKINKFCKEECFELKKKKSLKFFSIKFEYFDWIRFKYFLRYFIDIFI